MKKFAVTVAVLALGVAACQDNAADNNVSTVNTVEEEAAADTNAAAAAADEALNDSRELRSMPPATRPTTPPTPPTTLSKRFSDRTKEGPLFGAALFFGRAK